MANRLGLEPRRRRDIVAQTTVRAVSEYEDGLRRPGRAILLDKLYREFEGISLACERVARPPMARRRYLHRQHPARRSGTSD